MPTSTLVGLLSNESRDLFLAHNTVLSPVHMNSYESVAEIQVKLLGLGILSSQLTSLFNIGCHLVQDMATVLNLKHESGRSRSC